MDGPHPLRAAWSIMRARRVQRPAPEGTGRVDHEPLRDILDHVSESGSSRLAALADPLEGYRRKLETEDPNRLGRFEALAFWLNLYNAAALALAGEAQQRGAGTVLRVPGAFDRRRVTIAGESLSLNEIEHGKIRRFRDPRIHAALVCGAVSCPTLRGEPYEGATLSAQLDDQMSRFLGTAAVAGRDGALELSRVFLWYGADFVRPHRMPTLLPVGRRRIARALRGWMAPEAAALAARPGLRVRFQPYDWGLGCAVG